MICLYFQLLVWEWRSETYVLKQQGHYFDVSAVAFSPDGSLIATGGLERVGVRPPSERGVTLDSRVGERLTVERGSQNDLKMPEEPD